VLWLLFALSRRVICNSEAVKDKIAAYGVPESKIVPIPAFSVQYLQDAPGDLPEILRTFYGRFSQIVFSYLQIRPEFNPVQVVQAFAMLSAVRRDVGLVLCGVSAHREQKLWTETLAEIEAHRLADRIAIVDDVDHDAFLEAMRQASVYLRPPATDGVASSVLEALSLRVPVVAADNGARPAGVICYPARDVERLAAVLLDVLDRREEIAAAIEPPAVRDTLSTEAALLTGDDVAPTAVHLA
jgi:glycosyltransferase involved in cell wall biosynthesis